jgi:maleylpyruvate isomerase
MPGRTPLPHLEETLDATTRLLDTLATMDDADVRVPSVLPGWSRAHVITHLARNADGLAGVLAGAQAGDIDPIYRSQEGRDDDIEAGAGRSADELRRDVAAAADRWRQAAEALTEDRLESPMARLPGGPTQPVRRVGMMRWTEVEVHHADLGAGYTAADWPAELVAALMKRRHRELTEKGIGLRWTATETGESWATGDGPEVTGRTADLVWWLLGRGGGERLACSEERLPEIGRWA